MYKYIDDIIEFNSILDNKSSNILSMEDFNDLQILESSGSIFNKNWEKFFEYLYKLVLKQKEENKLTDITKRYTPEEEEELYIKITKDKFEEFGCKFPGGDKFDYIYVAVLDDPYNHMGKIMLEKKMKSGHIGSAYSQSSKLFFDGVIKKLKDNNISFNKVYYGEEEFCKWDSEYKRPYFYDFVIPDIYLCIEYNGLKFHPKEGDIQWIGLYGDTYEHKIQYDKRKLEVIENCGYKTLVIWEDDDLDKMSDYIVSLFK